MIYHSARSSLFHSNRWGLAITPMILVGGTRQKYRGFHNPNVDWYGQSSYNPYEYGIQRDHPGFGSGNVLERAKSLAWTAAHEVGHHFYGGDETMATAIANHCVGENPYPNRTFLPT